MKAAVDKKRCDQNQEDVSSKRSTVASYIDDKISTGESLNTDSKKNCSEGRLEKKFFVI